MYPFFVRSPDALKIDTFDFNTEAVITAGDGDVGNVFHHYNGKFGAHQRVYVIDGFRRVDPRYFYFYFSSEFRRAVSYGGAATTVASLRRPMFTSFPVCVPPRDEQLQIAEFLDYETGEIDAFIADQERLIELLIERRAATIAHELSAEGRVGWQTLTLGRLNPTRETGVSVNGSAGASATEPGQVGVLKTGAASKGYFDPIENKAVEEESELARVACPVKADRVLVTRANTPLLVGTGAYISRAHPNLYLSDKLWQIDFGPWTRYIAWWMHTDMYLDQARMYASGASPSMWNLAYEDFRRFSVTLPPQDSREIIVERIDAALIDTNAAIADAREAIALSKERRAALISAAVTGRIDVRDWERPKAG